MKKKAFVSNTIEAKRLVVLGLYGLIGLLALKVVGGIWLEGDVYLLCCADEIGSAFIAGIALLIIAGVLNSHIISEEMMEAEKEFLLHK